MPKLHALIYAIGFQMGWFICIIIGGVSSLCISFLYLSLHIGLLYTKDKKADYLMEALWLLFIVCFGVLIETLFFSAGLIYTKDQLAISDAFVIFPPAWLICLWMLFAILLRTSLSSLLLKPWLAYILTAIMVPLNYKIGAGLNGNLVIQQPVYLSLTCIAITWVIFLAITIKLKKMYFEDIFNDR